MKQKWVLIISVLIGLAAFWLTHKYFQAKTDQLETLRARIEQGAHRVDVIAVGRDLPVGEVLKREDLRGKEVLESEVGRNAILTNYVDEVVGKRTTMNLLRGDALFWSYLDVPFRPGAGVASMIKGKMRAISISASGAASVSGLVQPNDQVDILGTFFFPATNSVKGGELESATLTLLQDVTVLAVGQTTAKPAYDSRDRRAASGGYATVTLEVTPREAELLVFAETVKGRLTLSLRNPTDVYYESELPTVNFELIEKNLKDLNLIRQRDIRHKKNFSATGP